MSEPKPKPCPFCGSTNIKGNIRRGSSGRYFYYISCSMCRGQSGTVAAPEWIADLDDIVIWYTEEYEEAISKWNTRREKNMTHWKELYVGEYGKMELIDRKKLLADLGYDDKKKLEEDFDKGNITEETTDLLSFIDGAEVINPVDIILEYEKNTEKDRRTNP